MHAMGAIAEEDKLDADEAKKVLRRAGRMALPFKKTIAAALAFTAMSTLGMVLGPVILGWAIDNGIGPKDSDVLRNAVIFYIGLTVLSYLSARQQYILINRAGEGFLRDLRIRVFDLWVHARDIALPLGRSCVATAPRSQARGAGERDTDCRATGPHHKNSLPAPFPVARESVPCRGMTRAREAEDKREALPSDSFALSHAHARDGFSRHGEFHPLHVLGLPEPRGQAPLKLPVQHGLRTC